MYTLDGQLVDISRYTCHVAISSSVTVRPCSASHCPSSRLQELDGLRTTGIAQCSVAPPGRRFIRGQRTRMICIHVNVAVIVRPTSRSVSTVCKVGGFVSWPHWWRQQKLTDRWSGGEGMEEVALNGKRRLAGLSTYWFRLPWQRIDLYDVRRAGGR